MYTIQSYYHEGLNYRKKFTLSDVSDAYHALLPYTRHYLTGDNRFLIHRCFLFAAGGGRLPKPAAGVLWRN